MKCRTCGKDSNGFKTNIEFVKHCKECKRATGGSVNETIETSAVSVGDLEEATEQALPEPPQPLSIPLSICPPDLAYLHENRQIFLQVSGRKIGDRFVIEEIKMLRR